MSKKYELLKDDSIKIDGIILYRIKALKDFSFIKRGELGGYIESERNFSHHGNAMVYGDAMVYGNEMVSGDAWVSRTFKKDESSSSLLDKMKGLINEEINNMELKEINKVVSFLDGMRNER